MRFTMVLLLLLGGSGCAPRSQRLVFHLYPQQNLLFGAPGLGKYAYDTPRGTWPATSGHRTVEESVVYRETVIDRQGRYFSDRNDYYRRFEAVREGKTRR